MLVLRWVSVLLVVFSLQAVASIGRIRLPVNPIARSTSEKGRKTPPPHVSNLATFIPAGAKNGLASAMASAMVKFALQPFDTIKTVQQMDKANLGFVGTTTAFIKKRGVAALWSGAGLTVVGSAPAVACYYTIYNAAKLRLVKLCPKPVAVAVSASLAMTAASVLRAPYEVLKTRMQVGRHPTLFSALKHSLLDEGVLGLFGTGKLAVQIARDVPYAIVVAVSYEWLQEAINKYRARGVRNSSGSIGGNNGSSGSANNSSISSVRSDSRIRTASKNTTTKQTLPVPTTPTTPTPTTTPHNRQCNKNKHSKAIQDALCGSIAGGLGTLFATPMDVVKTRLMGGDAGIYEYTSVSNAIQRMWQEEGLKTFFLGTSSRLMHKIPANGLFYIFYESFRTLLGVSEKY